MKMQGQHEALELQLQERYSRLERENTQLRRQNEALQRSEALCYTQLVEAQQALLQRERTSQERAAEQALVNELRQRDRILEATATAANALLTVDNFARAVNKALQIIGEALDTDRVTILEHFKHPSQPSSIYWRILYEWDSPHAVSQISHPELAQGSYEGIEDWYELGSRGQGISCLLEEMPLPFRSGQAEIGVKALNAVPIFVEGKFWGCVGFDDCREAKRRSSAELAVLRIAADCIGSAIQRDALAQKRHYQPEELELAQALAQQVTLAIQLTRLAAQSREAAIWEERNRMAQEIHDSLAQAFTGILMQLQAATRLLSTNSEQSQSCITRAQELAREGLAQARRSVGHLSQSDTQDNDLDLLQTLTRIAEQLTAGTSVQAQVDVEGTPYHLNPEVGINLLRIAQESLTNALRHSMAQMIQISLFYERDRVQLRVQDNGQGFDLQHQVFGGFGLKGMRQRCDRIAAHLEINTQPGAGTEIIVTVPHGNRSSSYEPRPTDSYSTC